MYAGLQEVKGSIAAATSNQVIVRTVLDQPAAVDRHDAVGAPYRRKTVRDDDDRAPLRDLSHVVLDDPFALIIKRARRLVENQNARICDQRPRDRDALPLATRKTFAAFADERVVSFGRIPG